MTRDAHRADVHQAPAYASLAENDEVSTVLAYPVSSRDGDSATAAPAGIADLAAGRRRVRLILAGLPFGFPGPAGRDRALAAWERTLRP